MASLKERLAAGLVLAAVVIGAIVLIALSIFVLAALAAIALVVIAVLLLRRWLTGRPIGGPIRIHRMPPTGGRAGGPGPKRAAGDHTPRRDAIDVDYEVHGGDR